MWKRELNKWKLANTIEPVSQRTNERGRKKYLLFNVCVQLCIICLHFSVSFFSLVIREPAAAMNSDALKIPKNMRTARFTLVKCILFLSLSLKTTVKNPFNWSTYGIFVFKPLARAREWKTMCNRLKNTWNYDTKTKKKN